jgi:flavorubredoxin
MTAEDHMTTVDEIASDVFRISTFFPETNLQFAQFLVRDDEPLLFHTGLRAMFPLVRDAVATLIDPRRLQWVGFSHYEADECGSLNEWLAVAPAATPICSFVGKVVSVDDVAARPARALAHEEVLSTGGHRLRFLQTPHVPHCWDAGLLFDETTRTLFCSDLMQQNGDTPATTQSDVVGANREAMLAFQEGPLANYLAYTPSTDGILQGLASLEPRALATMHGATFIGDGGKALREAAGVIKEVFGG